MPQADKHLEPIDGKGGHRLWRFFKGWRRGLPGSPDVPFRLWSLDDWCLLADRQAKSLLHVRMPDFYDKRAELVAEMCASRKRSQNA
eukprot:gnl/TRDRNA2_/TRDRNA2_109521_c2_seq2.p1 gnl/TRDRNA2_/TRDRNA2_109521_c2~~gnl/TRDRNA2_/TRDRNA2_109521_c2_seq2.p1  ORF type:complete len:102 (+),score=9.09 gnl/TRDRNA2_/TRDRNA2_109521_c2_seq2:47-307(+)